MYCLVSEKPLRLVYGTFYLAIGDIFYEFIKIIYDIIDFSEKSDEYFTWIKIEL